MTIVVGISAFYGIINRPTHRNITASEDFYTQVYVAQFSEKNCLRVRDEEKASLQKCPVILSVEPISSLTHDFCSDYLLVEVKEVFKGSSLTPGDIVRLASERWNVIVHPEFEPMSMSRGFSNIMLTGKDYLVFISEQYENPYDDIPVYRVFDDDDGKWTLNGVFCYDEIKNVISENHYRSTNYVPYCEVKYNEFFAETTVGMRALEELKAEMLIAFPKGSVK
jgi:hypothetical protein